jgi:hypothetical protein
MPGSQLLILEGKPHARPAGDLTLDRLRLVPDNDDDRRSGDGNGGLYDVAHHGFSQHLMQDLGSVGFHAFAEPGSQYDNGDVRFHVSLCPKGPSTGFPAGRAIGSSYAHVEGAGSSKHQRANPSGLPSGQAIKVGNRPPWNAFNARDGSR